MRKRKVASIFFTGMAMTAATTCFTTTAGAASTRSQRVRPDAAFEGTVRVEDATTGVYLTCPEGVASDRLSRPTVATPPVKVGTLLEASVGTSSKPCSAFGFGFTVKLNKPAALYETSEKAGIIYGSLRSISAVVTGMHGFACKATVSNSAPLPYSYHANSANGRLVINPSSSTPKSKSPVLALRVKNATGCSGEVSAGNRIWIHGDFVTSSG